MALNKVRRNIRLLRDQIRPGGFYSGADGLKEAVIGFLDHFVRARSYLPENSLAARDEIIKARQAFEGARGYISSVDYELIRNMLIEVEGLLEKQQVEAAMAKIEATFPGRGRPPPLPLPYIASPFQEGFPEEIKGSSGSAPKKSDIPFGMDMLNILLNIHMHTPVHTPMYNITTSALELKSQFGSELKAILRKLNGKDEK